MLRNATKAGLATQDTSLVHCHGLTSFQGNGGVRLKGVPGKCPGFLTIIGVSTDRPKRMLGSTLTSHLDALFLCVISYNNDRVVAVRRAEGALEAEIDLCARVWHGAFAFLLYALVFVRIRILQGDRGSCPVPGKPQIPLHCVDSMHRMLRLEAYD
jgi:hypothetical protein